MWGIMPRGRRKWWRSMHIRPLTDAIGAEICDVDIAAGISDRDFERIYDAWIDRTIILFRGQRMNCAEQIAFTSRFGEIASYTRPQFGIPGYPEILVLSNVQKDGKPVGSPYSGRVWHTDGHYLDAPPAGSLLYALEVPPDGGDTWFANMFAAYDALSPALKARIEGLQAVISRVQSRPYNYPERPPVTEQEREEWVDMPQPLVRTHPVSGRKALYAGGNVPWRILGLPEAESVPLITYLQEMSVRPCYTYRHKWQVGDVILWDNRSALHKATPYESTRYIRHMHRTTVQGDKRPH
jgi:alpha-ketoglutarate-dependent taurine dioxygenase